MFTPITRPLLAAGVPLGPNGLLTVRGRKSGLPRTTPLAIIDVAGRRWLWSPWGDVQWVRNLRAAGSATITVRGRRRTSRSRSWTGRSESRSSATSWVPSRGTCAFGMWFVRTVDGTDLDHPVEAAEGRAVFELHPR